MHNLGLIKSTKLKKIIAYLVCEMEFTSINCKGRLIQLSKPIVMGILNLTPDSFYDGGRYEKSYLLQIEKMLNEGATIIDIGAMSSRPGSEFISEEAEIQRLIAPIQEINGKFPDAILSVDTFREKIACLAIEAGASIINDISAGNIDEKIIEVASKFRTPYILMHMQGLPKNMQKEIQYDNVTAEVLQFFIQKIETLRKAGIFDIIIDPGFGFGKETSHNYTLLKDLGLFKILNCPIMVGLSRKSIVNKVLHTKSSEALNGTTALHMLALQNGAKILRVHDVKEAYECILLHQQYIST